MNALDRLIGWVAPTAGLKRARARAAMELTRGYEAAKTGRRNPNRTALSSGPNAVIAQNLGALRARSRNLIRNNPYARRAADILVANIIGDGIMAQPKTGNADMDRRVLDLWRRFVDQCDAGGQLDFYGLQALCARACVESGEVLIRRRGRRESDNLAVPLQLQAIEPDYLDGSRDTISFQQGGTVILQGIEFDALNRRLAYWLYREHPGDLLQTVRTQSLQSVRVLSQDVAHVYRLERPQQVRGVPWLAAAMVKLDELDEYHDAALLKAKIEACFGAFVTQGEGIEGAPLGKSVTTENGDRIESFEPGMIAYLRPGETVDFANPTASAAFEPYTIQALMAISVATGVTYDQLTGDLRQANYSSLRAGKIEFRRIVSQAQHQMLVPMLCQPTWDWFIAAAIASGQLPDRAYPVRWVPPRHEPIDPLKDTEAEIAMVRAGLSTLKQAIGRQGYDADEHFAEIAETNKALDALELVVTTDPRRVDAAGKALAAAAPTEPASGDAGRALEAEIRQLIAETR